MVWVSSWTACIKLSNFFPKSTMLPNMATTLLFNPFTTLIISFWPVTRSNNNPKHSGLIVSPELFIEDSKLLLFSLSADDVLLPAVADVTVQLLWKQNRKNWLHFIANWWKCVFRVSELTLTFDAEYLELSVSTVLTFFGKSFRIDSCRM